MSTWSWSSWTACTRGRCGERRLVSGPAPLPKWRARGTGTRHHGGGATLSSARELEAVGNQLHHDDGKDFYAPADPLWRAQHCPANKRGSLTRLFLSLAPSGAAFYPMVPCGTATNQRAKLTRWPGTLEIRRWTTPWSGADIPTQDLDRAMDLLGPARCRSPPIQERDQAFCHAAPRRQQRGGLSRPHGQISPARRCRSPHLSLLGDRLQEAELLVPGGGRCLASAQHGSGLGSGSSSKIPKENWLALYAPLTT